MELIKSELAVIEKAIAEVTQDHLCELNELQLAIVGGGIGDVVPH